MTSIGGHGPKLIRGLWFGSVVAASIVYMLIIAAAQPDNVIPQEMILALGIIGALITVGSSGIVLLRELFRDEEAERRHDEVKALLKEIKALLEILVAREKNNRS